MESKNLHSHLSAVCTMNEYENWTLHKKRQRLSKNYQNVDLEENNNNKLNPMSVKCRKFTKQEE